MIYVNVFTAKKEVPIELVPGRVYHAEPSGNRIAVVVGNDRVVLNGPVTNNDNYYCEVTLLTHENYKDFKYTPDDKVLVYGTMEAESMVKASIQKIQSEMKENAELIYSRLGEIEHFDVEVFEALGLAIDHVADTYKDKYEVAGEADLSGLMRDSPHAAGFNVGNAMKYCKRYLTKGFEKSGNVNDLYKAIHYLLYQIIAHKNAE
jgi:hypothetical protein